MTNRPYPVGKLPMAVLAGLLQRHGSQDPRVLSGVAIGQDATIIDMGDRYLVAKTDPVTFATDQIGWYVVNVCANDLACYGAQPRWFLCALLLPEGKTDQALVDAIFAQIAGACRAVGASLAGGHTEITFGLPRPIVVGHMLGEVDKDRLISLAGAQVGDVVLLTKALAIEGTALIAREKEAELRARGYDDAFLAAAQKLLYEPGISVLRDAMTALAAAPVHAMHDPTEGGLATGLHEMARAAGLGVRIDGAAVSILPACRRLCAEYGLQPLNLLASGSLLLAAAPADASTIVTALAQVGIACAAIGQMTPPEQGCTIVQGGAVQPLSLRERDEITKILGE